MPIPDIIRPPKVLRARVRFTAVLNLASLTSDSTLWTHSPVHAAPRGTQGRRPQSVRHAPFASLSLPKACHVASKPKCQASATDAQQGATEALAIPDVTGRWIKDRSLSDPMGPALDLMQLGGVIRQAVKLVRGLDIHTSPGPRGGTWSMSVFSVIS
ncbi:uncharacterized protein HaLaN_25074, partial [Haematococcus lacustris]